MSIADFLQRKINLDSSHQVNQCNQKCLRLLLTLIVFNYKSLDEIELIDDEFDKEIQKSKEDEVDLLANQKPALAKEKKKKNLQVKIKLPESIPKLPPKKERTLQKCCLVFFLLLLFIIATGILIYFFGNL